MAAVRRQHTARPLDARPPRPAATTPVQAEAAAGTVMWGRMQCDPCQVTWTGHGACWCCGQPGTGQYARSS